MVTPGRPESSEVVWSHSFPHGGPKARPGQQRWRRGRILWQLSGCTGARCHLKPQEGPGDPWPLPVLPGGAQDTDFSHFTSKLGAEMGRTVDALAWMSGS